MRMTTAMTFGQCDTDILSLSVFIPLISGKNSKNPIQKSKFFNLADMFGYQTMPDTEKIADDLNGRTWEEF